MDGMDGASLHVFPVDGHLRNGESEFAGPGQDLHVEGEAVDPDQVEQEPGHRRAEGLEPALGVLEPEPGPGGDDFIEHPAHE